MTEHSSNNFGCFLFAMVCVVAVLFGLNYFKHLNNEEKAEEQAIQVKNLETQVQNLQAKVEEKADAASIAKARAEEDRRRLEIERLEKSRKDQERTQALAVTTNRLKQLRQQEAIFDKKLRDQSPDLADLQKRMNEAQKACKNLPEVVRKADLTYTKAENYYLASKERLEFAKTAAATAQGTHNINKTANQLNDAQADFATAKENYINAKLWYEKSCKELDENRAFVEVSQKTLRRLQANATGLSEDLEKVRSEIQTVEEELAAIQEDGKPIEAVKPPPPPPQD
ncbi:MAG: hypothetical protein KIS92_19975 [Planctomycetota bacterium]|nr:hypothetical protein [Planctomycetota bacterium]